MAHRTRKVRTCRYCRRVLTDARKGGSTAASRDHIVPKCMGGRRTVPCCRACNEVKGDMAPDQWFAFMAAQPAWWTLYKTTGLRGVQLYAALILARPTNR